MTTAYGLASAPKSVKDWVAMNPKKMFTFASMSHWSWQFGIILPEDRDFETKTFFIWTFTNYANKILAFFWLPTPVLTFSMVWTLTKSGHFWTTYLPCLLNVVCEWPLGWVILSNMGHICKICKKYGRFFATHSFTPSLAFVLYWAFSWWNCSPWPWLAWEFTSTTLKMAHFHAIWHQHQLLPPLQVSHNELIKFQSCILIFWWFHKILLWKIRIFTNFSGTFLPIYKKIY